MEEWMVIDDSVHGFKDGVPLNAWELEDLLYGFISPWEELSMLFSNYDDSGFGEMSIERFRAVLYDPEFRRCVVNLSDTTALQRLEFRTVENRGVTYQEFSDIVSNKRRHSFSIAMHGRDYVRTGVPMSHMAPKHTALDMHTLDRHSVTTVKDKIAYKMAQEFLPGGDVAKRKYYSLEYRCCPPPLFIPLVAVLQVCFFVYYALQCQSVYDVIPVDSVLIYRSDKRVQIWRFLFYALLHAGVWHIVFNTVVQLLIGLPLEMVHGSGRIMVIYLSGVLAGSLGTSVFDRNVFLVGASGGVYALLAAHVANVLLNFSQVDCGLFWLVIGVCIASVDVAYAIYDRYAVTHPLDYPVSYIAHLAGALAGLTLGLLILKSFDRRLQQNWVWWVCVSIYMAFMLTAIVCNFVT